MTLSGAASAAARNFAIDFSDLTVFVGQSSWENSASVCLPSGPCELIPEHGQLIVP